MQFRNFAWVPALAVLAGCTTWHHTQIADKAQADRQFAQDDGYCTLAAHGSVPVPQVRYSDVSPRSSSATFQGSTYNTATGATTFGNYSGQITTTPSPGAAFAGGFANGMNMGSALSAALAQKKVYKECMYSKGWSDTSGPVSTPTLSLPPPTSEAVVPAANKSTSLQIYATPQDAWLADVSEFLTLYPAYKESPLSGRLDEAVRKVATDGPADASGPQILLATHKSLVKNAQGAPEPREGSNERFVTQMYRDAAANETVGQNALGMGYMNGWKPLPLEPKRALFWFQKSALAGDPMGQTGYGLLLFNGKGVAPNKPQGYKWVAKAASAGDQTAMELLGRLEATMTRDELESARASQ